MWGGIRIGLRFRLWFFASAPFNCDVASDDEMESGVDLLSGERLCEEGVSGLGDNGTWGVCFSAADVFLLASFSGEFVLFFRSSSLLLKASLRVSFITFTRGDTAGVNGEFLDNWAELTESSFPSVPKIVAKTRFYDMNARVLLITYSALIVLTVVWLFALYYQEISSLTICCHCRKIFGIAPKMLSLTLWTMASIVEKIFSKTFFAFDMSTFISNRTTFVEWSSA